MTPFTLCTFNLRYGTAPDGANAWANRRVAVLACLDRHAPDILATQELLDFQIRDVLERFDGWRCVGDGRFRSVASGRPQEPGDGEHCAVFFRSDRFRLLETWTRWLSETPGRPGSRSWGAAFPRVVTLARLQSVSDGRTIDVYNTHFDWGEAFLRGSAMLFRRWVAESPPGAGLVVTGDFNVDAAHPLRRALTEVPLDGGRRLRDAVEAWGAAAAHPTRHDFTGEASERIDWIIASSDLAVLDAATDTGSHGGRYPSDHFPVLARLGATGDSST